MTDETPATPSETAAGTGNPDTALIDDLEMLRAKLTDAETEIARSRDTHLRAAAELENTKKRLERDAEARARFVSERLLTDLLAVADSLELGLKAAEASPGPVRDGIVLTQKQFLGVLEKHGVKVVDPQGQPFDAERHQAMSMAPATEAVPAQHVASVMQKGYTLHDRLLRPALVSVAQ